MTHDLVPQLAESIDKTKLPRYLPDDRFFFEQKVDGHRKLIWLRPTGIEVLNRQGKPADAPQRCLSALPRSFADFALDCELVDDELWIFDLPYADGIVTPDQPYSFRRDVLDRLAHKFESDCVHVLPAARTMDEKMTLSRKVIEGGGEGLMVKDSQAKYLSGKRHTGILKAKFVKDVDAFITRFGVGVSSNGSGQPKANCELAVYDETGKQVVIGECIIHPKERNLVRAHRDTTPGVANRTPVVTVQYLYCVSPDRPRLVQPTRIRPRTDKAPDECLLDQLRFTDRTVHSLI